MRRADMFRVGPSVADFGYNLRDPWWGIPRFGAVMLAEIPKQLDKLCEIGLSSEHVLDSALVEVKTVRRKLKPLRAEFRFQRGEKAQRGFLRPLADLETRHQLSFRVESDKHPLIADFGGIGFANATGFLSDVAPDFIALHVVGVYPANPGIEHALRVRRRRGHQRQDRAFVQSGQPRNGANAHALKHHGKRLCCRFGRGVVRAERLGRVRVGERGMAGIAAPALNAALTEVPKLLTSLVLTFEAGHGISPLAFGGETSHNELGSRAWVTPRFGLAPPPVSAGSGALSQLLSDWWRPCHRFLPAFLKRRALRGVSHLLPKSIADPFMGRFITAHSALYKSAFTKTHQDHMNGSHRVLIAAQVEPAFDQPIPNFGRRKRIRASFAENSHNRFGKAFRLNQRCDFRQDALSFSFVLDGHGKAFNYAFACGDLGLDAITFPHQLFELRSPLAERGSIGAIHAYN
jgi:hypothetical protein